MTFEEGVNYVKNAISTGRCGPFDDPKAFWHRRVAGLVHWYMNENLPWEDNGQRLRDLLEDKDRLSYEVLWALASAHIEIGKPFPPQLREWTVREMRNPQPPDWPKEKIWLLNVEICLLICDLVDAGMKATRGELSFRESACDAVSEALQQLRLRPASYSRVEDIWSSRAKSLEGEFATAHLMLRASSKLTIGSRSVP